ncbi:MAG TPA: hypothetical protein VIM79_05665 [Niastella sp.]
MIKYMLFFFPWPFELLPAQSLEVYTHAGYFTGSSLKGSHGRFIVKNSACYSGTISYIMKNPKSRQNVCFELQYAYTFSTWRFEPYNTNLTINLGTMAIHSILAGAGKKFGNGAVQPYGAALLGATYFNPETPENGQRLTFTFSFTAGLRIAVTSFMGICLQAQAMLPLMYNRVYTEWEPNTGVATAVAPVGIMYSGYLTGGIYWKLVQ